MGRNFWVRGQEVPYSQKAKIEMGREGRNCEQMFLSNTKALKITPVRKKYKITQEFIGMKGGIQFIRYF